MRVSIIILVYNAERTRESCVNSIMSPELDSIGILLIENDLKDASYSLCQKFMGRRMARYFSLVLYCVKTGKVKDIIKKILRKISK